MSLDRDTEALLDKDPLQEAVVASCQAFLPKLAQGLHQQAPYTTWAEWLAQHPKEQDRIRGIIATQLSTERVATILRAQPIHTSSETHEAQARFIVRCLRDGMMDHGILPPRIHPIEAVGWGFPILMLASMAITMLLGGLSMGQLASFATSNPITLMSTMIMGLAWISMFALATVSRKTNLSRAAQRRQSLLHQPEDAREDPYAGSAHARDHLHQQRCRSSDFQHLSADDAPSEPETPSGPGGRPLEQAKANKLSPPEGPGYTTGNPFE